MADIKVLNQKFEAAGNLKSPVSLSAEDINVPVVHQVVKAILAGRRQGTVGSKNKALVSGGGKKPFKQKGTGRARQGSNRSPLMVGGGSAFGPQMRDHSHKVNRTLMLKALQSILADKFQAGKLTVVETLPTTGKTKDIFKLLNDRKLLPGLVVTAAKDAPVLKAVRNLQWGSGIAVDSFNVYEAVKYENLIIEKSALENLFKRLG